MPDLIRCAKCPDCYLGPTFSEESPSDLEPGDEPGFWVDCQYSDAPIWGQTEDEAAENWND